ncbi:MAG TPA: TadE/TadG family type IV pilus assembly protein [Acidimicrobiales bacterium]
MTTARRARDGGQAAVELALALPLVALLLLLVVQVGLVVRAQVLVIHGAREGARAAAVDAADGAAREAVLAGTDLDSSRLTVEVTGRDGPGSRVTVEVRYRMPTAVPMVGALVGDVTLTGRAAMRVET